MYPSFKKKFLPLRIQFRNIHLSALQILIDDASYADIQCPVSELPICPAGSPTYSPEASSSE